MSDNKPRIAFCFSWQARTLDQTYLFFQKNLFDAAKEQWFDYDVFCAVEDDEDVDKVKLLNPTKVEKIKSSEIEKIIEEKYGDFIRTAFKTKYKWAYYTYEWVVRYLQQIYKVSRSIKLCGNYEKYNIIVRLRFDTIFINKFNYNQILKDLNQGSTIICNDEEKHSIWWKICYSTWEIQDFFFFWDNISMKKLWNIFDKFEECFLWHEVKPFFKPIYIVSNRFAILFRFFKIPTLPLEFWAYMIFIAEKCYYEYFLYNKIHVLKKIISIMILKHDIKTSYVRLEWKSDIEL